MGKFNDLTGQKFGRLTVIKRAEDHIQPSGKSVVRWECKCSCNKHSIILVESRKLRSGEVNSCGCIKEEEKLARLFEVNKNNNGCLMKIVEYNNADDVVVEFQDEYKTRVRTKYGAFKNGEVRNPYHKSECGVGIIGNKYPIRVNGKIIKEYKAWHNMLERCFKSRNRTYENVTCCNEWLLYENFYEWIHSQDNFDRWLIGDRWEVDKDIIIKGNKIYSPETCCLVPHNINCLFLRKEASRGELPIGVSLPKNRSKYLAHISNNNGTSYIGYYETVYEAFQAYKEHKENLIKQIAQDEYSKNNITKRCYEAMMKYEVEITD